MGRTALMGKQYAFINGHFIDTWNDGITDEGPTTGTLLGDVHDTWHESILTTCGCGTPTIVARAMGDYLVRVALASGPQIREGTTDHTADYLIASMADDLELTEHGTTIYGCWITDAGRRWLELWRTGQ